MSVMRRIDGATVFRLIQIALLPLGIVSYVIFVVNLVAYSRRTGSAATVLASLYTRYMQHMLGERPDAPAMRLASISWSSSAPASTHARTGCRPGRPSAASRSMRPRRRRSSARCWRRRALMRAA
jgi:hypothetical protein